MQRSELLWSLSGTHTLFFFRLRCHCRVQQLFKPVNVLISKIFTGLTNWQTDKTNSLTPLCMRARGNEHVQKQCSLEFKGTSVQVFILYFQPTCFKAFAYRAFSNSWYNCWHQLTSLTAGSLNLHGSPQIDVELGTGSPYLQGPQ